MYPIDTFFLLACTDSKTSIFSLIYSIYSKKPVKVGPLKVNNWSMSTVNVGPVYFAPY